MADALVSYQQQGKRSYYLASTLSDRKDQGYVLRRLSDQFELCAFRPVSRSARMGENRRRRPSVWRCRPVVVERAEEWPMKDE